MEGGMCVEEPDIEIGQGVSSKGVCDCFFIFIFLYRIYPVLQGWQLPCAHHSLPLLLHASPHHHTSPLHPPLPPGSIAIANADLCVAISKRLPTDSGGDRGPRSSYKSGPGSRRGGTWRVQHDRHRAGGERAAARGPPGGRDDVGVAPPTPRFRAGFPFSVPTGPRQRYPGLPPPSRR